MPSALHRLARRPAKYARHNAAAALMRRCSCPNVTVAASRWHDLWASLLPISDSCIRPLAQLLSAALHMAAEASELEGRISNSGQADSSRFGLRGGTPLPEDCENGNDDEEERRRCAHQCEDGGGRRLEASSAAHAAAYVQAALGIFEKVVQESEARGPAGTDEHDKLVPSWGVNSSVGGLGQALPSFCREVVRAATRRHLALVTPEVGEWCSVGGLGTMVDHLSTALAARGSEVSVIAPAYDCFASRWAGLPALLELSVPLGRETAFCRVRSIVQRGVSLSSRVPAALCRSLPVGGRVRPTLARCATSPRGVAAPLTACHAAPPAIARLRHLE